MPFDTTTDQQFLDSDPPHWAARGMAWFILALVITASIAVAVVHVPETVSAGFILLPQRGADPVRALREGVVRDVRVVEGQTVLERDVLFVIQSGPAGDRNADLRTLQAQVRGAEERMLNATELLESQRRTDQQEETRLRSRIAFLNSVIESKNRRAALTRELADSARSAVKSGAVGRMEWSRLELEATTLAEDAATAVNERDGARVALSKLRQDEAQREINYRELKRSLEETNETGKIRITMLERDVMQSTDSGVVVRSLCAGTVLRLNVKSPGAVVKEGEVLSELACGADRLQAELAVPQEGVPLVKAGQGVKLRFDAFPYQRYGVRFGTVRWLGSAGVVPREGSLFRALVDLEDDAIAVDGQKRLLMAGMGGRADIVIGSRSLVSYAFEPIRALRENFRQPPAPAQPNPTPTPAPAPSSQ